MGRQVGVMTGSDLRIRMRVYEQQEQQDGQGGTARVPVEIDQSWGGVTTLSPQRQEQSAQAQQRVTHKIVFRYSQRMLKITDELHYRDFEKVQHVVSVKTVVNKDERAKIVVVEAEEVININQNNPDVA